MGFCNYPAQYPPKTGIMYVGIVGPSNYPFSGSLWLTANGNIKAKGCTLEKNHEVSTAERPYLDFHFTWLLWKP